MAGEFLWGIDLGGTKIEGAVITPEGQVLARLREPTERHKGYEHIIRQIGCVLAQLRQKTGHAPLRLGIGTPGTTDPRTGLLKNSNTVILNGRPFQRDVESALGLPVTMANDANCFAMAEAHLGAGRAFAKGRHLIFGVIMGTGVGGGIVIDGRVWSGAQGIGGEWGHSFLDAEGGACYCGKVGCVETLISGPALEQYHRERNGGTPVSLSTIVSHYQQGKANRAEAATVERLLHFFGRALANVINILDPTAVVLGGGLSNIDLL